MGRRVCIRGETDDQMSFLIVMDRGPEANWGRVGPRKVASGYEGQSISRASRYGGESVGGESAKGEWGFCR